MKRSITATILLVIAFLGLSAQTAPSRSEIIQAMECANDYFIAKYPDPGAVTFVKKYRPSNLWTRGVYFEGLSALMDLEAQEGNKKKWKAYHKYIYDWGTAHKWTPRNGITTRDADDYCCSQTYLDMYLTTDKYGKAGTLKERIQPTIDCMDHLVSISDKSRADWTWIDAIQMGLPVMAKLARIKHLEGDDAAAQKYLNQGWQMYICSRNELAGGLYNTADGLWWRDKDFVAPYKEPNGEDCYWSRGNGWVYAALVRTMDAMLMSKNTKAPQYKEPLDETEWTLLPVSKHFGDYKKDFIEMSEALLKCQRLDHFWNVSLHDESNFGGKELTGTALFIYGMAWGVRHGILPADKYTPVIIDTWNAMVKDCLHSNGVLGFVQGTGKEPKDSQPVGYSNEPDFDDFGLGCFLLAGSEVYRMNLNFGIR